jgi:hypothetical protein
MRPRAERAAKQHRAPAGIRLLLCGIGRGVFRVPPPAAAGILPSQYLCALTRAIRTSKEGRRSIILHTHTACGQGREGGALAADGNCRIRLHLRAGSLPTRPGIASWTRRARRGTAAAAKHSAKHTFSAGDGADKKASRLRLSRLLLAGALFG